MKSSSNEKLSQCKFKQQSKFKQQCKWMPAQYQEMCAEGRLCERVTAGGKNKINSKIMESKGVLR